MASLLNDVQVSDRAYYMCRQPERVMEACGDELNRAMENLSAQRVCCCGGEILLKSPDHGYPGQDDAPEQGRAKRFTEELVDYAQEQGIVRDMPRLLPREQIGRHGLQSGTA